MDHEQGINMERNSFYRQEVMYVEGWRRKEWWWRQLWRQWNQDRGDEARGNKDEDIELLEGKLKREKLKEALLNYIH